MGNLQYACCGQPSRKDGENPHTLAKQALQEALLILEGGVDAQGAVCPSLTNLKGEIRGTVKMNNESSVITAPTQISVPVQAPATRIVTAESRSAGPMGLDRPVDIETYRPWFRKVDSTKRRRAPSIRGHNDKENSRSSKGTNSGKNDPIRRPVMLVSSGESDEELDQLRALIAGDQGAAEAVLDRYASLSGSSSIRHKIPLHRNRSGYSPLSSSKKLLAHERGTVYIQ